ncbi:hypothetical protein V8J36_07475 [Frigidibacter sp. MR17.14]|uniref:hypothetical protein n=1 Tax=Frigidibacter sp. MR17.14 TaxID=3126509 RepID=UPI003012F316
MPTHRRWLKSAIAAAQSADVPLLPWQGRRTATRPANRTATPVAVAPALQGQTRSPARPTGRAAR